MTEAAITASVLILAVLLVRFLFKKKISRRFQYALWALVLIRLLMPFPLFESKFSVMNSVDAPTITGREVYVGLISRTPLDETQGVAVDENGALTDANSFGYPVLSGDGETVTRYAGKTTVAVILKYIWLAGSLALALWFAAVNTVFYVRLRKSRVSYPREHTLPLRVYVSAGLATPCLFGLLRPCVYLTPKAADNAGIESVLIHEYCHYRHGDHIWSLLRGACLALYWWNPLVWAAAALSRADSELACDEAAIERLGENSRLAYGKTLVDMIAVRRMPVPLMCAATTMTDGKRAIRERLNLIVQKPRPLVAAIVAAVLIVAVAAGCAFTGARQEKIYERFGLELAIPVSYDGVIDFATADKLDDNMYLVAYHIPSRDAGWGGKLFTIVRHRREDFAQYSETIESFGGATHFAVDETYVYSIEHPTDVQTAQRYWRTDADGNADSSLSYLTKEETLVADFIARNGLSPYQAEDMTPDSGLEDLTSSYYGTERSYRLGNHPLECATADGGTVTVYLTAITLRENSAFCSFIYGGSDAQMPNGFPELIAVTADGVEYTLNAVLVIDGAAVFECAGVPLARITALKVNGETLSTVQPSTDPATDDVFTQRLGDLPDMAYSELFAYCAGSDGAYAEGVYSEMAKRFIKDPEAFAVHFMLPTYPFADDYKESLPTINPKYAVATLRFDQSTRYSMYIGLLHNCTPEERDAAIDVLRNSDIEIAKRDLALFALADNAVDNA